jgi:predicted nucleotidyltransferase
MTRANHSPLYVVQELLESRYVGAKVIFLAGSVIRGEANAYSDVDLVVVFPRVERAYRESFYHRTWPVEAFVHDPDTMRHFFLEVDRPIGSSSLAEMVSEGLEVPSESDFSRDLKQLARQVISEGPPAMSEPELEDRRYQISELLDDIREPRNRQELFASASVIYGELAEFFLRSRRAWAASGKGVIKRLKKADAAFARRFFESFDLLYATGRPDKVVEMGEDMLSPQGGLLFDGYRREAPQMQKRKV